MVLTKGALPITSFRIIRQMKEVFFFQRKKINSICLSILAISIACHFFWSS